MPTNFDECGIRFSANTSQGEEYRQKWTWHGPIVGIPRNYSSQISREGCMQLCGHGVDFYPWTDVSGTITTWILPVVGTLLQAPFESNAAKRTLLAITRWVGSPIASISYVLWNIKVSAKAAVMVDMAVKFEETPDRDSHFGSMRDSMYLLLVMNQYTLKSTSYLREKEAEGLLRIVLFSKDLVLADTEKTLQQLRQGLAEEVREMRRRGAVPAFISIMWFLFSFALSIQDAFSELGANTTAHDLALGCLLGWFPILIMGSIVDRNPVAADAIRKKLNKLVDHTRDALRVRQNRSDFVNTLRGSSNFARLEAWVNDIAEKSEYMDDFFTDFAGQARVRWHYGAAHPILSDIENCYIAEKGRNWLANDVEARASLVLGPVNDQGLVWFDPREFWQVASAIIIVAGSCGGAFILSYFTPTVGLGCRSGGYSIFFSVSLGLLIFEMAVWLLLSPHEVVPLRRTSTFTHLEDATRDRWKQLKRRGSSILVAGQGLLVRLILKIVLVFPWKNKKHMKERVQNALENRMRRLRDMSPQRKWEVFFFRPVEIFNTIWLVYIVFAQVIGWYKTCDCVTSVWAGGGGYLDFNVQDTSNSKWVLVYWTSGTLLTSIVLGLGMFYITVEWCQQSFLSTESYQDAMHGLRMTRTYRYYTFTFRRLSRLLSKLLLDPLETLAVKVGVVRRQNTLLWTSDYSSEEPPPLSSSSDYTDHSAPFPPIELHEHLVPSTHHSPFTTAPVLSPSTSYSPRFRAESNSSLSPPSAHSPGRTSNESSLPFLPPPSGSYTPRRPSGDESRSSDARVSFEETTQYQPIQGSWLDPRAAVHSRQGYRRANSESEMPPGVQGDLVIHLQGRDANNEEALR